MVNSFSFFFVSIAIGGDTFELSPEDVDAATLTSDPDAKVDISNHSVCRPMIAKRH